LYHTWIAAMTRQQERLDVATFLISEIIIKTDFAATAELKAQYSATCEYPTSASQCVALVVHSPGGAQDIGEERPVQTDYWRAWSSAKPSHIYHQMFMDNIIKHYKVLVAVEAVACKVHNTVRNARNPTTRGFCRLSMSRR
jgi:hypothetical protein